LKNVWEAPIELAEYWRLRDAGRIRCIYTDGRGIDSPRTPPPGIVHLRSSTRSYIKGIDNLENVRKMATGSFETPEMIERLDYIFHRLEALKQQREEGRAINVLASQEQYYSSASSVASLVRGRGRGRGTERGVPDLHQR
jgi:hypothetical protein